MNTSQNQLIKAINYIYQYIDHPISLAEVSEAAAISEATLKRIFNELLDESPGMFIRKLRMELAFKSLQSRTLSVIETALSVGYQDHAAFSRRFKQAFGYTPSSVKEEQGIMSELDHIVLADPDIVFMNAIKLQAVTEQGSYFEAAPKAWDELKAKLGAEELDDFSGMFVGVGLDNPHEGEVPADQVRFCAGVSCIDENLGVTDLMLPAGKYARFYFKGKTNQIGAAYHYILGQWPEKSGHEVQRDSLIYQLFDTFPTVEGEHAILICVPLL